MNSETDIVCSLFLIFGDFEPRCSYEIVRIKNGLLRSPIFPNGHNGLRWSKQRGTVLIIIMIMIILFRKRNENTKRYFGISFILHHTPRHSSSCLNLYLFFLGTSFFSCFIDFLGFLAASYFSWVFL